MNCDSIPKAWFDVNLANWQAERDRMDSKPFIIIYLKGKPEVANACDIQ